MGARRIIEAPQPYHQCPLKWSTSNTSTGWSAFNPAGEESNEKAQVRRPVAHSMLPRWPPTTIRQGSLWSLAHGPHNIVPQWYLPEVGRPHHRRVAVQPCSSGTVWALLQMGCWPAVSCPAPPLGLSLHEVDQAADAVSSLIPGERGTRAMGVHEARQAAAPLGEKPCLFVTCPPEPARHISKVLIAANLRAGANFEWASLQLSLIVTSGGTDRIGQPTLALVAGARALEGSSTSTALALLTFARIRFSSTTEFHT